MPNKQPMPNLDRVQDPDTKAAIQKLWEALYISKQQTASAFALVSPSNADAVKTLLGLS